MTLDALEGQANATVPEASTGAVILAALQARPYPEIDLTPPRVRITNAGCASDRRHTAQMANVAASRPNIEKL
jgi:hypothetical protein